MTERISDEQLAELITDAEKWIARGYMDEHHLCALRELAELRDALEELITWIPSADTYRRLGFDPEAPMRAVEKARAALAKENSND